MVRSMFLRDKSGTPYGCLAVEVKETEIHYQLSVKNPIDRWDRKRAHEIAVARLTKRPFIVPVIMPEKTKFNYFDITYVVMMDLINSHCTEVPGRAVKSAKRWVNNYVEQQPQEQV